MEAILILLALCIPAIFLVGLVLAIVALTKANTLKTRIDRIEADGAAGGADPLAHRLHDLELRIAALEARPPADAPSDDAAAEPETVAPAPTAPAEPSEPTSSAPMPPAMESGPDAATLAASPPVPPEEPEPVPEHDAPPVAATEPEPTAPRPAAKPRPRIDWERWIGVRGAAAAGGIVLALASLLFFQYSIEHGLISPTMRVVLGVLAGIASLVGSEWLVKRGQPAAANALAGAGIVILYGATWAAQNLYDLIGSVPAFVLMVLITAACVALAVGRRARFIAVLGLVGGFAAPVLVASDVDSPAALFGYILLLDLGLLWLARARGWPLLAILSLAGTALHQAIWVFSSMDAERAVTGLVVLAVFGLAFLVAGRGREEPSALWRATRAGAIAVPFAFALHFASTAELAENPWPLGLLLLVLSAGACWLDRKETPGAAVGAAGASVGVVALWFLGHDLTPALAWQATGLCVSLAALFAIASEAWRHESCADRLGIAALTATLGFLALLVLAAPAPAVILPWPWIAGWAALAGMLALHSKRPDRGWVLLPAGVGPAFGLFLATADHLRSSATLEPWTWLALAVAFGVVFQILALVLGDGARKLWAERAAAATAMTLMVNAAAVGPSNRSGAAFIAGVVLVLGLLAVLAATRMRSGPWLLAGTAATALWQTVIFFDAEATLAGVAAFGPVLAVLTLSAALFTVWPAAVVGAFRDSRSGWWGAALAGPLWFGVLRAAFVGRFGDGAVGLVPVILAAVALATVLWAKPRLADRPETQRTALVWYLAVTLSLVSVAIPLQLENEWITIGWALNGIAILALWIRLDHPSLKYFGLALLAAATVRLIANPEVLSYHIRVGTPVLNWLTYTYLVPAAALVLGHRFLRPREVDRLVDWEERFYPGARPIWSAVCGLGAVAVVFAWINLAIADLFATGPFLELSFQRLPARDAVTSVAWAVYALILLAIGVRSKSGSLRWLSLGILVLTLGKVFLHDLGELEDLYRVGSLVGLALSLIVVSLIYQQFVFASDEENEP